MAEVSSPDERRLLIDEIVCTNFKSYAGVVRLGPFHKRFTAIMGPNGSGKSNVIDAMLFVFGFRASKIRSKKISVLIHNSENYRDVESCSVAVHFHYINDLEGEGFTVVEGSGFVVGRTAHKDGSSYYTINGHRKPFRDVSTLLRENGIDLDHNRFLILQGEVEQIALMKPKAQTEHEDGMLEYLEDIIGSSKLKEPIEEMHNQVEKLNEKRLEKLNRARAVEKEKLAVEEEKDEAEEYLKMKYKATHKQHSLYQRYIHECRTHELKAKEKKDTLDAQIKEHETSVAQISAERKEKLKAQKKDYKGYESLAKAMEKCKEKMADCEQQDVRARQDLKNSQKSRKKMARCLGKEKTKLLELEEAPEKHENEIKKMETKLTTLEARRVEEEGKLAEIMESLKTATLKQQREKEKCEAELVGLRRAANEAKSKFDVTKVERDLYREKHTRSERELQETDTLFHSTSQSLKDAREKLSDLDRNLHKKVKNLTKWRADVKKVSERCEGLNSEVRKMSLRKAEAREAMEANKTRSGILRALIKQRDQRKIRGIYGRLGDLGTIDDKYDVAVSTAHTALDFIVVDTMETAVKCVEFLDKANLGIATFLALDKIGHLKERATTKIDTPESVPRLFDLIRPKDPIFHTAFYKGLGDTLLASNLDQAVRIGLHGRHRYRVVTLEGQMIETSGAMSGGGQPRRGRMASRLHEDVSVDQLRKIEQTLSDKEEEFKVCEEERVNLEEKIKNLEEEVKEDKSSAKEVQRSMEVLRIKLEGVKKRKAELEKEEGERAQAGGGTMDEAHLKELEGRVKKLQKEYEFAESQAAKIDDRIQRLNREIMEVTEAKLKPQQTMVDKLVTEIDEANSTITKATVGIKTVERDVKKCKEKISSLEQNLNETENKIETLKGDMVQLEEEATEILAREETVNGELKEVEELMEGHKKVIEEMQVKEAKEEAKLMDVRHEVEKYSLKLRENQQKIVHFKNEMKKLDLGEEEMSALTVEELEELDKKMVEYEITMLEEQMKNLKPNMAAIDEYKKKEELHQARLDELDSATEKRNEARRKHEDLRRQRLEQFMTAFTIITLKLKEMYQMLTLGGDAELELADSLDPFSEGIVFTVRPPKKSWKNIMNLSGGEKTLSSLALVFALHHYKPSPLYVMDEIDAALDFRNVSIVGHYIKERTKNAQFIIISLRNNMFELADRLVGIYKPDNCSMSVTINPSVMMQRGAAADEEERKKRAAAEKEEEEEEEERMNPGDSDLATKAES